MSSSLVAACRSRALSSSATFCLVAVVAAGCNADKANADRRKALVVSVRGTSEELYGVEMKLEFDGEDAIEQPLAADGRFLVPRAPAGNARITLRDLRRRFATQTVTVESPGEHELSLIPGTHFRTTIRGEDGAALSDAKVAVLGGGTDPLTFALSEGGASFGPLPSGAFKLVVSSPGYQTRVIDLTVKRTSRPGTLRDLPDLHLKKGGKTLRGRLMPTHGVGPVRACLRHDGASQEIDLRPDGSFHLSGLAVSDRGLEATLVVRDNESELLARDLLIRGDLDLGRIPLR